MSDLNDKETVFDNQPTQDEILPATEPKAQASTAPMIGPGVVLGNRYLIEAELGRGGIGIVYLARDNHLDSQLVVIKTLLKDVESDQWLFKKFRHESEALARITHPGVVKVLDRGQAENGKPYFVMEFIEGKTLRSFIPPRDLEFARAATFLRQIGQALTAAHQTGVIHRDLKPDNIMIQRLSGDYEQAKLIDFGIAKVQSPQSAAPTTAAKTVGTIEYMAPEQIETGETSPASDIYSLGIIAYELLTGRRPFKAESSYSVAAMIQVLEAQKANRFTKPRELRSDLPPAAQDLILKAMSGEPARRPQRVEDFTELLAQALSTAPPPQSKPARVQGDAETVADTAPPRLPHLVPNQPSTHPFESPQAGSDAETVVDTARRFPEPPPAPMSQPVPISPPLTVSPSPPKFLVLPLAIAGVLILVGTVAVLNWPTTPSSSAPTGETPIVKPLQERTLSYWIEVQKFRNGKPYETPFVPLADINFEKGYKIRLNFVSQQSGHLYIFNEGPIESNQLPNFNMMFPTPTTNDGSSALAENKPVQLPEQNWLVFDAEAGTEKFWILWSAQPIAPLEAIRDQIVNETTRGVLTPEQIKTVQSYTSQSTASQPEVVKDEAKKQTRLTGKGEVLIYLMKLEHY